MRPLSLFVIALAGLIAVPALAQSPSPQTPPPPVRIRGTVDKLDGDTLTVKTKDGQTQTITVADKSVQYLVKKSLSDIKAGDFLASTGVKGTDGKIHAVEVRIFPKATPDGGRQFAWDLSPDSVMTNATVGQVTQTPNGPLVHVTFTGGESEYTIGPDVPDPRWRRRRQELVGAGQGGFRDRQEGRRRQAHQPAHLRREGRRQAADVALAVSPGHRAAMNPVGLRQQRRADRRRAHQPRSARHRKQPGPAV